MRFGFSYIGLFWLLMLFLPNLIWTKHKPSEYAEFEKNESRVLLAFERIGEALVCCVALVFSDFNLKPWSPWSMWLIASFALMILYEIWWIRYFRSEKRMADFYSSIIGIPVAGATLPVAAFILLAIYGKNPVLGIAAVFLGIGHIGIHMAHRKEWIQKE